MVKNGVASNKKELKNILDGRKMLLGKRHETKKTPFNSLISYAAFQAASNSGDYKAQMYEGTKPDQFVFTRELRYIAKIGGGGRAMEITADMFKAVSEEVACARDELQSASSQLVSMADIIEPQLIAMTRRTRETRMSVTTELKSALSVMRDVRMFFMDKEYKQEMERLERFVLLAERMKALIDDGTMDAICDISLKLAEGGKK